MLFWTICCWTSRRLLEPGQHHFQGHTWWVQIPIGFTRRSWNSESNRFFMVVFQRTSGIPQHLVLLSPGLCGIVPKPTTDLEVLVPGGGSPFVGPPQLLDRVSSRDSPVNSEDNLSSNKDEEDSTGEVAEVVPTGMNLRLEDLPLPLVIETLRVGARLTNFVQQWQNLLGDCRASRTLGNGVQLEWESLPPLTRTPISFSTRNTPKDLQTAVDKLLSKGAIEPVFRPETKGFFSRLFLVPKKTGDLRPVIDLSRLNDHLVIPRFKMETQASVRASIKENEWTVSIDIQDAYLHVPMARSVRKYLRFMVNGRVSVYMPPVRLGYLSSGVYQVAATSGPASAAPRYQAPCISGRLAHPSIVHRTGQNSCRFSPAGVTTPWMGNQFQQVRLGSQPAVRFYRHAVQHVRLHRGTSTQNAGQNPEHPGSLEITPAHIRQGSPQTFGYVDIHGHSGAKRSTTPPPNPVVGVRGMVPGDGVLVRQDFSDSDHSPSGGLVGLSCGAAGGFTECPRDRDNFIHRCLQSRMGGAAGLPYAARDVVSTAGKPAYKSVRDGGSVSECNSVPASTHVSGSAPDVRQRRGCFVHQQGRRDQIVQTDSPDDSALEILRPEGHQASACSSSRITQHPGKRSVASGSDSCDGVGHQWPASSSGVLCMGNTSDRSVCNFCQQEAACLRITISGPEGQIRRCDVSTVVRDGNGVRLPTIQDAAGCPQQDPQVSQPVGDLNSSTPDVSIMDARAIRAVSLSSNTTGRASTSYSRSSAAQRSRRDKTLPTLKSTRLATLKGLFVKLGYSRRVAECMSTNLRPSSIGCYESHWSRFVEYCRRKHLNVFEVDSRIFSKCLLHLFENERYAPSTIISHRTSIASVLRHWKYDPATDPRLRALLRNFQLARPVQRRLMPQWDLHLVLTALLRPPFTDGANDRPSDDVIDLKWRTLKTTFLLALATARRRSFLHALCVSTCLFTRGDVQDQLVVNLLPQAGFLAKTQLPDQAPQWIRIPGIAHLNPGELERMLCSVRQLQLYLRDTERIRGGRTRLLLHWDPLIDDIQRTHVSRWLVEVVKEAYTRADLEYDDDIRAHELRAIASSWAYVNQVRLEDILAAASWRSSGVFQGSYLRDMSSIADGMATLGPIVAAQHVVCTRRQ